MAAHATNATDTTHAAGATHAGRPVDPDQMALLLEKMERMELIGKRVRLSDGREGPIVHVEYESPRRVALVKAFPVDPCPLTRAGVDRLSPPHLPYIVEIEFEPPGEQGRHQER